MSTKQDRYAWLSERERDKFNRQQAINILEKITKSMFRLFRDQTSTKDQVKERFSVLYGKLKWLWEVYLDTEYHRAMLDYVQRLEWTLDSFIPLDEIRNKQMRALNGLQKLRNVKKYKRR